MKQIIIFIAIAGVSLAMRPHRELARDTVDWIEGKIIVKGEARLEAAGTVIAAEGSESGTISLNRTRMEASRRAREDAIARLARLVKTIRVDGGTMVSDILERDEEAQRRLSALLSSRTSFREYPTGFLSSACMAEFKIGDLIHILPFSYPMDPFPARIDAPIPTVYTGLVIDARGIGVEPMILPSIYGEDGLEIFGRTFVDIRRAGRWGIASYAFNEDEAMRLGRAGARPYYCAATREMNGCPVLANRDVRKIFSSNETIQRLRECHVVFIIDKPKD